MYLVVQPKVDERKNILDTKSEYNPDAKVRERFRQLKSDFEVGDQIMNKTYTEFNNKTVLEKQNQSQKSFNIYVPEITDDPTENWKANTVSPIVRNKIISIAAHIISSVLYPYVIAQNKNNKEDKTVAMIVQDLVEDSWEKSKYMRTFVYGVIAALVNPAWIVYEGYAEVRRKIKQIQDNGSWKEKEILDEVWSGYQNLIVPVDELYIGDVYEHDIQKQPFIIWRRIIDYSAAEIKYGSRPEFKYVRPGVRIFFNDDTQSFYEQSDDSLSDRQVEEVVYYNRLADLELPIVNGVLMTEDPDRPIQRWDGGENKFYPFAKTGYELVDEGRFFYYKSCADTLSELERQINLIYNMVLDGTFMQIFPPTANYGEESLNSSVMIPGSVTNLKEGARLEPIAPSQNVNLGSSALQMLNNQADESSQAPRQAGIDAKGSTTAFEVSRLEENAKVKLGLFGKMLAMFVEDFGQLRLNTTIRHSTVADVEGLVGDVAQLAYKTFVVPDRMVDGKKMPRRIEFTTELPTQENLLKESLKLLKQEKEEGISIIKANPVFIRNLKYKVKVNSDFLKSNSEAVQKALNLEAYDRAIANPLANQEAIFRDFLLSNYKSGEEDKYINKQTSMAQMATSLGGTSDVVEQIAGAGQLPLSKQL